MEHWQPKLACPLVINDNYLCRVNEGPRHTRLRVNNDGCHFGGRQYRPVGANTRQTLLALLPNRLTMLADKITSK